MRRRRKLWYLRAALVALFLAARWVRTPPPDYPLSGACWPDDYDVRSWS